jgi:hypothetical protein
MRSEEVMILSFRCCAHLTVQIALLGFAADKGPVCGEPAVEEGGDPLPLSVESVPATPLRALPTSAKWDGREYDVESGIHVLMGVVRNPEKSPDERHYALLRLSMLDRHLKGRPCLDELAKLYDVPGAVGKGAILLCFKASDDPRAIPVFIRALDTEKDMKLRLSAAAGLAQWNIRRGVAELVRLLDSPEEMPQPSQLFYVRDNALDLFRTKNRLKGWGFPDDKESAEWPPDVMPPPDVAARLKPRPTVGEIKRWFAENEHRFPDWKLGDPLPEVPSNEKSDSNGKKP